MKSTRIFAIFLLFYFITACKGGLKNEQVANNLDSGKLVLDSAFLKNKDKNALDLFLQEYTDSINNAAATGMPICLKDPQFDYHHSGFWPADHLSSPLRKLLIDKLTNCDALKRILEDKTGAYKVKPSRQDDINVDYLQFSFFELAQMRSRELKCP